jgi:hypothetical protein
LDEVDYDVLADALGLGLKKAVGKEEFTRHVEESKANATKLLLHWLKHDPNNRWLLILDNCNDDDFNFASILPTNGEETGHVLMLSNKGCDRRNILKRILVSERLGPIESRGLFLSVAGKIAIIVSVSVICS